MFPFLYTPETFDFEDNGNGKLMDICITNVTTCKEFCSLNPAGNFRVIRGDDVIPVFE
jgi:hypothetical protein